MSSRKKQVREAQLWEYVPDIHRVKLRIARAKRIVLQIGEKAFPLQRLSRTNTLFIRPSAGTCPQSSPCEMHFRREMFSISPTKDA